MVFRATSKPMLWYLEQQGNTCPIFGEQYFVNLEYEQIFATKKLKCHLNKRIDLQHIME